MTEHPKMTCRREGHDPQIKVTNTTSTVPATLVTQCLRCGEYVEVDLPIAKETA